MNLDEFEKLVLSRRAVRHFKPDPLPEGVLERLLDIAHWAPSGYNLQPTHFVVVTDPERKKDLHKACMFQPQILEAPATVVFTGDRKVVENNFERIMKQELEAGSINAAYEQRLREKFIPLAFRQGPCGVNWLWKAVLPPLARLTRPVPSIPAVQKRFWLAKQVMLTSMVFMLAANAADLATVPMEGFDEILVRQALDIPRTQIVPIVIPIGYATDADLKKTRLPLEEILHYNRW